jgi:zinc transport system ATP-binding protein
MNHGQEQSPDEVVRVERLCVEFDGEHVLEDVNLTIRKGEFVALLGPNGSGKSTLVRAVLGLQPASHGKVWLFGTPQSRFREWTRISLVPQRLPGSASIPVSVWEAVLGGLISPRRRWRPFTRSERAAAAQAITDVGLAAKRHERLDTLSGGQQRRVLIARALASGAELLVMDEPTAGVDAENVERLTALLGSLRDRGATIIVVTHELADLEGLVTRAVLLSNDERGSIAYDGPPPVPGDYADHVHHHEVAGDTDPNPIGLEG